MAHSVVSEALKIPTYRQPLIFAPNINGTKEFPLYSFASDKRSGMYMKSVGVIGLAANSNEILALTERYIDFKVPLRFNGKTLDMNNLIDERNKTQSTLNELKQQVSECLALFTKLNNTIPSIETGEISTDMDDNTVSTDISLDIPKITANSLTANSLPANSLIEDSFIAGEDIPKASIVGLSNDSLVYLTSGVKFYPEFHVTSQLQYYTYNIYEKSCLFAYVKNSILYIQPSIIDGSSLQYGDPIVVGNYNSMNPSVFIQPFNKEWLIFADSLYSYRDGKITSVGKIPSNILSVIYDELTSTIVLFYRMNKTISYQLIKYNSENLSTTEQNTTGVTGMVSTQLLTDVSLNITYNISFKACLAYGSVVVIAVDNNLKAAHISGKQLVFGQSYKDADMYSCESLLYCTHDNYVITLIRDVANTPYIGVVDIVGNEIVVLGKTRLQFHMNDVLGISYNSSKNQLILFQYEDTITAQFFAIDRDNVIYNERYISNISIPQDYRGSFYMTYVYNNSFILVYRTVQISPIQQLSTQQLSTQQLSNQDILLPSTRDTSKFDTIDILNSCMFDSSYGIHPSCFIGVSNEEVKQGNKVSISLRSTRSPNIFNNLPVGSIVYFNGQSITSSSEGNTKLGLCLSKSSILLTSV